MNDMGCPLKHDDSSAYRRTVSEAATRWDRKVFWKRGWEFSQASLKARIEIQLEDKRERTKF